MTTFRISGLLVIDLLVQLPPDDDLIQTVLQSF